MSLIPLGILAASGARAGDFDSIATVTVGSGTSASIDFTSISTDYAHLQIRGIFKMSGGDQWNNIKFNNETTDTTYKTHSLYGQGSSAVSENANVNFLLGNGSGFSGFVIDILDYANTNKFTTVRALYGGDYNGSGAIFFQSVLWRNTAAVNRITINGASSNFQQYSHFALYGIKAA